MVFFGILFKGCLIFCGLIFELIFWVLGMRYVMIVGTPGVMDVLDVWMFGCLDVLDVLNVLNVWRVWIYIVLN